MISRWVVNSILWLFVMMVVLKFSLPKGAPKQSSALARFGLDTYAYNLTIEHDDSDLLCVIPRIHLPNPANQIHLCHDGPC
jgi:hypothetical protein